MDKTWMNLSRLLGEYMNGLDTILDVSFNKSNNHREIVLSLLLWQLHEIVYEHLIIYSFKKTYIT